MTSEDIKHQLISTSGVHCRYVLIELHTVSHSCPRLCTQDFCLRCQVPHPPEDTSSVRFREKTVFRTLSTGFCVFTDALSHATRKRRVLYSASRQRLVLLYLTTLLVSNSYSPEPILARPPTIPRALQTPSPAPSPRPTRRGFAARAILPCIVTFGGWLATSVANGFTVSARVWTPSTMTC